MKLDAAGELLRSSIRTRPVERPIGLVIRRLDVGWPALSGRVTRVLPVRTATKRDEG
jgi:hypothetical protein